MGVPAATIASLDSAARICFAGGFIIAGVLDAIARGKYVLKFHTVSRIEHPLQFWVMSGVCLAIALVLPLIAALNIK